MEDGKLKIEQGHRERMRAIRNVYPTMRQMHEALVKLSKSIKDAH